MFGTVIAVSFGFLFRLWATNNSYFLDLLNTNEVSSPITSWKRATEGLFLQRIGVQPYDGDIFHQTPFMLEILSYLQKNWDKVLPGVFVILDTFTALLVGLVAKEFVEFSLLTQQKTRPSFHQNMDKSMLIEKKMYRSVSVYVTLLYLFNPYSMAACAHKSIAVFDNMILAAAMFLGLKGHRILGTFALAVSAYQTFYTVMLIVPFCMMRAQRDVLGVINYSSRPVLRSMLYTVGMLVLWCYALLYASHKLTGSWVFLRSTYGFILTVPELTPNMGIFWYFFTEMFQHFELFFLLVFQLHVFVYTIPLAIKLRNHPEFLMYMLVVITAIFKSYPTYGDTGFYISLLPCWTFLKKHIRNTFIVVNMSVWCFVLAPIFWHLWIYSGSANANFYFCITLVSSTAQIFLAADLLFAFMRREYDLYNEKISPEQTLILQ